MMKNLLVKSCIKSAIIILVKRVYKTLKNDHIWMVLSLMTFLVMLALEFCDSLYYIKYVDRSNDDSKYPIIKWWNFYALKEVQSLNCPRNIKCLLYGSTTTVLRDPEAYIFYGTQIDFYRLPTPRRPKDIIWALFHEESPRNVPELSFEPVLELFNYSSTFSRYSDVPFPLGYMVSMLDITSTKYFVETEAKNEYLKEISPVLYLNSDCDTTTDRDVYVNALMEFIPIDSYGKCLNNKQFESEALNHHNYLSNLYSDEFYKFVARYKFVIAIENGRCDDYITEKFWRAILVGSVPIYFGSPTIRDWLPNEKSALLIEDFSTPKHLAEHIKKLMQNDTMYEEYLTHKTMKNISNKNLLEYASSKPYQFNFKSTLDKFNCWVCEKAHNKQNGDESWSVINRYHYNCPKPISALTLSVNASNNFLRMWQMFSKSDQILKNMIMTKQ